MVGTNASKNENHTFYNSTVQAISRGGGDCSIKVGAMCDCFVDMGAPVRPQVGNGLTKLFNFRGRKIVVPDQAVFTLIDSSLHDK